MDKQTLVALLKNQEVKASSALKKYLLNNQFSFLEVKELQIITPDTAVILGQASMTYDGTVKWSEVTVWHKEQVKRFQRAFKIAHEPEDQTLVITKIGGCEVTSENETATLTVRLKSPSWQRDHIELFTFEKEKPEEPGLTEVELNASQIHIRCNEGWLMVENGRAFLEEDDCDGAGHSRGGSNPKLISREYASSILSRIGQGPSTRRERDEAGVARRLLG